MERANLDRAWAAFASGEWDVARSEFQEAAERDPSPEVIDGLGRTLWWLKDITSAIEVRTTAYGAYRQAKKMEQAARIAVWLARELRTLFLNGAAADGWLARAETIVSDLPASSIDGWIELARAEASPLPSEAIRLCRSALETSRNIGDTELEVVSLARLGPMEVAMGKVEAGVKRIDEAMAAATGGEARDPQCVAEAYCALLETADLLGDSERFAQWTSAISRLKVTHGVGPLESLTSSTAYGNLSAFCASCCGGMYLVTGKLDQAEDELQRAIVELEARGMQSRCVHPVTQLAELRVLQGRYEEARALLQDYEDLPEAIRPLAVLDLALGDPETAAVRLKRRVDKLAEATVGSLPLHTVLVDAYASLGEYDGAEHSVRVLEEVAAATRSPRHEGEALFASGKLLAASGESRAQEVLRAAALKLSEAGMALIACRARMEFARTLAHSDRPLAISEARASLAAFERLGAVPDADSAAAFLRDLGVKGRTGPKNLELLTKRETEVLRLIAQGLSNGEVAERLFISIKTAGHHVSNILSKLGLRSRTEAAAFASVHLPGEPVPK
jgi:DNA-binding CsgD family transcriptional regulator/tetratricopeptide (TPR) repeat protein